MKRFSLIFKTLKEVYPLHFVLLVFTPIIVGFIIDHELSDNRYIIINLIWIPIFTTPCIFIRKRIVYQLFISVIFLTGLMEISHWIIIKGPITITSLLVISNTNLQEAKEFLSLKATLWLIVLIPYMYLYISSVQHSPKYYQSKLKPYIIGVILLISVTFIFENAIHKRLIRKGVPQVAKTMFSFIDKRNLYKEAMQTNSPRIINAKSSSINIQQTFVLIIGESCNRQHMSLYGASRKTNPKLEIRNDLFVFNNVVSPYSNTLNSVLSMLSQSNMEQKISFENSIDIIDIFHSAGFKTYWISNQSPIGIWDNLVTVFAKKSDYVKFVNTSSNSSLEATYTSSYDSKLFKPFISALNEDASKKFIVLHLIGSHSSYSKRYPNDYKVFSAKKKREKIIAEYDNSILYNDFIVDSLINIVSQDINQVSSLIYISDHGENVYDEQDRVGHDYSKNLPKANVEVPFIVWLSPAYIKINQINTKIFKSKSAKPFASDDLFHSIMDLNNIQSPYLDSTRSIFNEAYNDARQRILEDGNDYDKIVL